MPGTEPRVHHPNPGAPGEGSLTGLDSERPRGYEGSAGRVRPSQSSIRIAPGLVGRYHYHRPLFHLNLHSLVFPLLGQLHTALPSYARRRTWGDQSFDLAMFVPP